MLPYWKDQFLNPSTLAAESYGYNTPLDEARDALAALLNASSPSEFYLTSGATEANNWVLRAVADDVDKGQNRCHIIVSEIEHPSILEAAQAISEHDPAVEVSVAPVDSMGSVDSNALLDMICPETRLVSVMLANNESGVIQPIGDLARQVKQRSCRCIVHTDATQAIGRIPVDLVQDLASVDCMSLSGHKFHGPKGIGALFIRAGVKLAPLLVGGGQENGMRAGTGNPPLAAGLATAASAAKSGLSLMHNVSELRDALEEELCRICPGVTVLGNEAERLPNTSFVLFSDLEGDMLVALLLQRGIIASTGSACSHGSDRPSHVAVAMGIEYATARNAVRFSLSPYTTSADIKSCIEAIADIRIAL